MEFKPNGINDLCRTVDGIEYMRIPVKTHVIMYGDKLTDVLDKYIRPHLQEGDVVFMAEKAVACTQKRAIKMSDIKPSKTAKFLCKHVYKNPYGIGLSIPETMQCALDEAGYIRILFAAFISIFAKLFGKRGVFYKIAGDKVRGIDGPCEVTLPPYNEYVVLSPINPDKVAKELSEHIDFPLAVVDANDLGVNILGSYALPFDDETLAEIIADNPLNNAAEQTPVGIIRVNK
jgi:Uncharacterized conserved protein